MRKLLALVATAALLAGGSSPSFAMAPGAADAAGAGFDPGLKLMQSACEVAAGSGGSEATVFLAQAQRTLPAARLPDAGARLQVAPEAFPSRVPSGKTYQIQLNDQTTFTKFAAGASLAAVIDCAQVPCPGTFGPDVVCWKCKERPAEFRSPGRLYLAPQ